MMQKLRHAWLSSKPLDPTILACSVRLVPLAGAAPVSAAAGAILEFDDTEQIEVTG